MVDIVADCGQQHSELVDRVDLAVDRRVDEQRERGLRDLERVLEVVVWVFSVPGRRGSGTRWNRVARMHQSSGNTVTIR